MLVECRYGGFQYDCMDLFQNILTDEGLCCIFNGVDKKLIMKAQYRCVFHFKTTFFCLKPIAMWISSLKKFIWVNIFVYFVQMFVYFMQIFWYFVQFFLNFDLIIFPVFLSIFLIFFWLIINSILIDHQLKSCTGINFQWFIGHSAEWLDSREGILDRSIEIQSSRFSSACCWWIQHWLIKTSFMHFFVILTKWYF